jgi:hypothetical protein
MQTSYQGDKQHTTVLADIEYQIRSIQTTSKVNLIYLPDPSYVFRVSGIKGRLEMGYIKVELFVWFQRADYPNEGYLLLYHGKHCIQLVLSIITRISRSTGIEDSRHYG